MTELKEFLSEDEIAAYDSQCNELAKRESVPKVHCCVIVKPGTFERVACFIREPNFPTKLNVLSKMVSLGIYPASDELREACTIKDASDPLTYGESAECDDYKLGVVNFCMGIIKPLQNVYDKKK